MSDKNDQQELSVINNTMAQEEALHLREGEIYDVSIAVNSLRAIREDIGWRMFEMGRLLTLIKLKETPATYKKLLADADIAYAFSVRARQMYRKFCGGKRAVLVGKTNSSKLLELMSESDDALDELADGGEIAGMSRDAIDNMSTRELQKRLRKSESELAKERETKDKLVSKRDEKIARLEEQVELGDKYPAAERGADLVRDICKAGAQIVSAARTMAARSHALIALTNDGLPPEMMQTLQQQLQLVWTCVQDIGNLVIE